ncbi:stage VI sporulation protein F [Melghiribacillus thermohalophilus]|uniref:Stage VI sporulation protein F n=1 Tax=Melghiribacillus thermohalophilus TaxID=1324956 RepID=A0A4R3NED2_9BACI|nr:stage VI sporulation protein F [Melghiribacillus thermohalophilus]TCT25586.1 stage VI sporulation protein F [Melghiribacillus thermohalophilus]
MNKDSHKDIFDHIQRQSDISPTEIMQVAQSVQNMDLSNEKNVRDLVERLAKMAGKPLPEEKEDQIVEMIMNQNMPLNLEALQNMMKK